MNTQAPLDSSGCQLIPTTIPASNPATYSVSVTPPSSGTTGIIEIYQVNAPETLLCTNAGCWGQFYFNVQPTTVSPTVISGGSNAADQALGFQLTFSLTKQ